MSKFTKEMVDSYAEKLLIGLTSEENEMVLNEFAIIDETINKINEIEGLNEIEPMFHCLDDFEFLLTEDEPKESIGVDKLLANSAYENGREIVIPKVVN